MFSFESIKSYSRSRYTTHTVNRRERMSGQEGSGTATADSGTGAATDATQNIQQGQGAATDAGSGSTTTGDSVEFKITNPSSLTTEFTKFIPEEYKTKEWVQNIAKSANPQVELFKQFESAQSMIGKNSALVPPGDNATAEQIANYHKAIGVPEDITGYKYDGLKAEGDDKKYVDAINGSRTDAFMVDLKTAAKTVGITPKQFSQLAEAYDKAVISHSKESLRQAALDTSALEEDFQSRVTKLFGDKTQAVMAQGSNLIKQCVDPSLQPALARMDNETLAVLASFAHGFANKYIREDNQARSAGAQHTVNSSSRESIEARRNTIMAHPDYGKINTPGYQERLNEVAQLRQQLKTLSQGR